MSNFFYHAYVKHFVSLLKLNVRKCDHSVREHMGRYIIRKTLLVKYLFMSTDVFLFH